MSRGLKNICKLQLLIMMSKYARLSPGFLPSCSTHSSKQTSSQVPLRAKSTGSSGDQCPVSLRQKFVNFFLQGDERTRQWWWRWCSNREVVSCKNFEISSPSPLPLRIPQAHILPCVVSLSFSHREMINNRNQTRILFPPDTP